MHTSPLPAIRSLVTGFLGIILGFVAVAVADDPPPEAKPAPDPLRPFWGNWYVTYYDYPEKGQTMPGAMWVWPNGQTTAFNGRYGDEYSAGVTGSTPSLEKGLLKLAHPYYMLGYWGGTSYLQPVGRNEVRGYWEYGDNKGLEVWRRAKSRVTRVVFHSDIDSETAPGGRPAVVERTWDRFWWSRVNDMRGNRPEFTMEVYGENMWGWHPMSLRGHQSLEFLNYRGTIWDEKAPDKLHGVLGYRLKVKIWFDSEPGRQYLIVDGTPIPFDYIIRKRPQGEEAPPEPDLVLERFDGTRVSTAWMGPREAAVIPQEQPFRVWVEYRKEPKELPTSVILNTGHGTREFLTIPDPDDPGRAHTGWLSLQGLSASASTEFESLPDANSDRVRELVAEHFAGNWQVEEQGGEAGASQGLAVVAEDGSRVDLILHRDGSLKRYQSVEILAVADETNDFRSLEMRFEDPERPGPPPSLYEGRETWPETHEVVVPDDQKWLRFEIPGKRMRARVRLYPQPAERVRVNLHGPFAHDRLRGNWMVEQRDGSFSTEAATSGRQTWSRAASIEGVIVVEDQSLRHRPGAVMDKSYIYPFGSEGDAYVQNTRTLFVYGKNLPVEAGDVRRIEGTDETIGYSFRGAQGEGHDELTVGWRKLSQRLEAQAKDPAMAPTGEKPLPPEELRKQAAKPQDYYDALLITATFKPGVTSGVKAFQLNGLPGPWHLYFANGQGHMMFAHGWREQEFAQTDAFYTADVGYVIVDDYSGIPHPQLKAKLHLRRKGARPDSKPVQTWDLVLPRVENAPQNAEYQLPIRIFLEGDRRGVYLPPEMAEAVQVPVQRGDTLQLEWDDPYRLLVGPKDVRATVVGTPAELGPTWKEALVRVAKCHGDTAVDFDNVTKEESAEYSRRIMMQLPPFGSRKVSISKGDHAAAILIRDEVVRMIGETRPTYVAVANGADGEIAAFIQKGRKEADSFWQVMNAPDKNGTDRPLAELLRDHTDAELIPKVRVALKAFVAKMDDSIARANKGGDCDVTEMMILAGRRLDPVIARILPRLVHLREDNGRMYWEPDNFAQGYVKSLYNKGEELAALKEYASIDDAYVAMGLALVGGSASFILGRAGLTAAGYWVAAGADIFDMAYYGGKDALAWYNDRELIKYAEGVAPATGAEFAAEAKLAASPWYTAAIGILLPGLGGVDNVLKARNALSVLRGAKLLDEIADVGDLSTISKLSDAERTHLAALYTDLNLRRIENGIDSLSEADHARLAKFDQFFESAGKSVPPSATDTLALADDMPEDFGTARRAEGAAETGTEATAATRTDAAETPRAGRGSSLAGRLDEAGEASGAETATRNATDTTRGVSEADTARAADTADTTRNATDTTRGASEADAARAADTAGTTRNATDATRGASEADTARAAGTAGTTRNATDTTRAGNGAREGGASTSTRRTADTSAPVRETYTPDELRRLADDGKPDVAARLREDPAFSRSRRSLDARIDAADERKALRQPPSADTLREASETVMDLRRRAARNPAVEQPKLAKATEELRKGIEEQAAAAAAKAEVKDLQLRRDMLDRLASKGEVSRLPKEDLDWLTGARRELTPDEVERARRTMDKYGNSWSKLTKAMNQPGGVSEIDMHRILTLRKQEVDGMLSKVIAEVEAETGSPLAWQALGSTNLTSDYDISVVGWGAERVVSRFNKRFRQLYGREAGTHFDTNIYTDPVYNLFSARGLSNRAGHVVGQQADSFHQFLHQQIAARKYLTDAEWAEHVDILRRTAGSDDMRRLVDEAAGRVERMEGELSKRIDDRVRDLARKEGLPTDSPDLRLRAQNELYGEILDDIDQLRQEHDFLARLGPPGTIDPDTAKLRTALQGQADPYREAIGEMQALYRKGDPDSIRQADALRDKWQARLEGMMRNRQGNALYYASEAYQTDGAIRHVVGEIQAGGKTLDFATLTKARDLDGVDPARLQTYVNSLNENRANMYKELNGLRKADGTFGSYGAKAAEKSAKYGVRQLDAAAESGVPLREVMDDSLIRAIALGEANRSDRAKFLQVLKDNGYEDVERFVADVQKASNTLFGETMARHSPLRTLGQSAAAREAAMESTFGKVPGRLMSPEDLSRAELDAP